MVLIGTRMAAAPNASSGTAVTTPLPTSSRACAAPSLPKVFSGPSVAR